MSFVSNTPVETHGPSTLTPYMRIYALQSESAQAFMARYPLSDLFDFTKVREVLSLEDVARVEILRTKMSRLLTNDSGCDYMLESFITLPKEFTVNRTVQNMNEITGSVNLLVQTPALHADVDAYLKPSDDDARLGCEPICATSATSEEGQINHPRIIILNDAIYILVEEGFGRDLDKPGKRLAFLSRLLKSAYAIYPVQMVNGSQWYKQYLRALAA